MEYIVWSSYHYTTVENTSSANKDNFELGNWTILIIDTSLDSYLAAHLIELSSTAWSLNYYVNFGIG